ncbi:MAG: hypothetical protein Q7K25_06745 [Actinomycetota bacterium]|nr:hypothetical protein [Actinomycetota bacterium]
MSQASDMTTNRRLIDSREIYELSMCSHEYLQKAIWWVRLAKALDVLAEEILCSNLADLGRDLGERNPWVREQATALDAMGDQALEAIDATRKHVAMFAGECAQAAHVRDSVKWVCKRVQLMNYLVEDLTMEPHGHRSDGQGSSQGVQQLRVLR